MSKEVDDFLRLSTHEKIDSLKLEEARLRLDLEIIQHRIDVLGFMKDLLGGTNRTLEIEEGMIKLDLDILKDRIRIYYHKTVLMITS